VVLVRPKEDGNIGAVARLARNFGADRLTLVAPRARVGLEARRRAMVGLSVLREAHRYSTLTTAVKASDLVIGTTDLSSGRSSAYLRRSVSPERLAELLGTVDGRVSVVFGPEDNGLGREELAQCDLLVHIPARRDAPTLNLSHAVAVVLYAAHRARGREDPESTPAPDRVALNGREKELILTRVEELARLSRYPAHKRKGLMLLVRRLLGRAAPAEAELRMLLGFLKSLKRTGRRNHGTT
jgi:tRNA/rRNA methyltransferase